MKEEECLFCKIARKEVESDILYENDDLMVILDAYPNVDGHTLVIPKKHYDTIYELPDELLIKMYDKAKEIGMDLMNIFDKESLTFLFNFGEDQAIKHVHLHILPNYIKQETKMPKDEVVKKIRNYYEKEEKTQENI